MKTIAYLGAEGGGGTYRVFQTLRDVLRQHGYAVELMNAQIAGYVGEDRDGVDAARALATALESFDAVIVNVFMARVLMNIARYLPPRQPRLLIVHAATHATYRAAREVRVYSDHTVAISRRIREDLVDHHGFAAQAVSMVLHGIPEEFFALPLSRNQNDRVRLLSLGRLNDYQKRISKVPNLFDMQTRSRVSLTIAGDGPDRTAIERAFQVSGLCANFCGAVPHDEVPALAAENEIFLFPSRFEGMGIALAEAMAAGLVPVAARIRGITDSIIEDGVNGFVFDQRDWAAARDAVTKLVEDPERRLAMRRAARQRAQAIFSVEAMGRVYAGILDRIIREPRERSSLPLSDWTIPPGMRHGWRGLLPPATRRWLAAATVYRE